MRSLSEAERDTNAALLGKFEMPTIVYVNNIVVTTEEEIA